MANSNPKGWEKDSEKLFIHESGVRVQRMTYKGKDGWYLVPVDLDEAVVEFEPTPEGRDKAFEAFAKGSLTTKPKKAKPVKKAPAKVAKPAEGEEPAEEKDDDDDEEDEKEEKEDEGEDA